MDDLIKRLIRYKEENDLTYDELARKLDIPVANIFRWIKGSAVSRSNKKIIENFLLKK